jgi:DNA primase
LSVKGGHEGLFVPSELPAGGLLLVTEGPTDCAAMLTLGFPAGGRPSCRGGVEPVCGLARGRPVVIVADADEPGRLGADALAIVLARLCPAVRVIRPPDGVKDARAWLQRGATARDVRAAIEAANPIRFGIKTRAAGR